MESERCASYSRALTNGGPLFTPIEGTLADGLAVPEVGYNAWETSRHLLDKLVSCFFLCFCFPFKQLIRTIGSRQRRMDSLSYFEVHRK